MVDTWALEAHAERCEGSSPSSRTNFINLNLTSIVKDEVLMFKCNGCQRDFGSRVAVRSHWSYCPMKETVKLELPPENVPFENMKWKQKRVFLLVESNYKCSQCGFSKTRENGESILEIDHVDGNHENNEKSNLRVLCPNCHALTPNFRNWGRGKEKSSGRFRKGNAGFSESRETLLELKEKKRKDLDNLIISVVMDTFGSETIDYRRWGWIGRLNDLLTKNHNLMFRQQTVARKIKQLMPTFYEQNCHKRL